MAALYDAHAPGVYGYVYALLGDVAEAEDVVQEVFARALTQSKRWFGLRNPVGYLYRAARNEALSRLRKRGVRANAADRLRREAPILVAPDEGLASAETSRALSAALQALPVVQREVIVLKVYREMTFKEIARLTGASANTVASRYRYGLTKLRELLEQEEMQRDA